MFDRLYAMLKYRRPHKGSGERKFYERFIQQYQPEIFHDPQGMVLAYVISVAGGDSPITTLFSAHIDTVHSDDGLQKIVIDENMDMVFKTDGKPLGADDAVGMWLQLEMIDAGVPGVYIIHRGEERGGIGSSGMAKHHADWLQQFTHAIAFDRKGDCSIITEQMHGKCCSNEFAADLAERLSAQTGFSLKPDPTGVYTDTAEYTDIIAECTNVSCGYYSEHTKNEMIDLAYLRVLHAACVVPSTWENLIVKREPGDDGYAYYGRWQFDRDEDDLYRRAANDGPPASYREIQDRVYDPLDEFWLVVEDFELVRVGNALSYGDVEDCIWEVGVDVFPYLLDLMFDGWTDEAELIDMIRHPEVATERLRELGYMRGEKETMQ